MYPPHTELFLSPEKEHTLQLPLFFTHSFQALFFLLVRFSNLAVFRACIFGHQALSPSAIFPIVASQAGL